MMMMMMMMMMVVVMKGMIMSQLMFLKRYELMKMFYQLVYLRQMVVVMIMMTDVFAVVSRQISLPLGSRWHSCLSSDLEHVEILNSEIKEDKFTFMLQYIQITAPD